MSKVKRRIAVLGSGIIGAAVSAALLDSGRRVRVWGASESWFLTALADAGAEAAVSLREAVRGADVVAVAPANPSESALIEAMPKDFLSCRTVLTVRGPADDVSSISAWLSNEDVGHVECVVFGAVTNLGSPSTVLLARGSTVDVAALRGELDCLGRVFPIGGASDPARGTERALIGLWYDVNVAVLRALANIDKSARPVVELELRAVLTQLPSVTRSIDDGEPVPADVGIGLHARALETVLAGRGAAVGTELEQAARHIESLLDSEGPRAPLARIAGRLRWPEETTGDPDLGPMVLGQQ